MSKLSSGYLFLLRHLVEARKANGITQVDLAEKLQKPQSFVSKFERGERRLDVFEYISIGAKLNITSEDLSDILKKAIKSDAS